MKCMYVMYLFIYVLLPGGKGRWWNTRTNWAKRRPCKPVIQLQNLKSAQMLIFAFQVTWTETFIVKVWQQFGRFLFSGYSWTTRSQRKQGKMHWTILKTRFYFRVCIHVTYVCIMHLNSIYEPLTVLNHVNVSQSRFLEMDINLYWTLTKKFNFLIGNIYSKRGINNLSPCIFVVSNIKPFFDCLVLCEWGLF